MKSPYKSRRPSNLAAFLTPPPRNHTPVTPPPNLPLHLPLRSTHTPTVSPPSSATSSPPSSPPPTMSTSTASFPPSFPLPLPLSLPPSTVPTPPSTSLTDTLASVLSEANGQDLEDDSSSSLDDGLDAVTKMLENSQSTTAGMSTSRVDDLAKNIAESLMTHTPPSSRRGITPPAAAAAAAAAPPTSPWCHEQDCMLADIFTSIQPCLQRMHVAHRLPSHSWESAVARFDVLAHEGMSAPCDASTTMTTEEVEEELMGSRGDVARRRRGVKGFLKRRDAWSAERITDRGEGIVGMGGRDVSAAAAAVLKPRSLIVKTLARWR